MTKVYHYGVADDAERLYADDPEKDRQISRAFGRPVRDQWTPVRMQRATQTEMDLDVLEQADPSEIPPPQPLRRVDFPGYGLSWPILSERARETLDQALAPHGEFLELRTHEGERYWLFNVLAVIDALDEEASEVLRFDGGRVMDIPRPVFAPERLGTAPLFRVPQKASRVYATGAFVGMVEESGLTGLGCRLVWSDETT